MLSVILTILKIIGIIILVLLGLLLLIILLILFVPIRYRVNAEHGDALMINGRVSWLFHIIHARVDKSDQGSRIWIRIFGFLVYDSSKQKIKSKTEKSDTEKLKNVKSGSERSDIEPDVNTDFKSHSDSDNKDLGSDSKSIGLTSESDKSSVTNNRTDDKEADIAKTKITLKSKIKALYQKIKQKIKDFIMKLFNIKNRVGLITSFLRNEVNKEAFRITFASFLKLKKHILPTKVRSKLIFGTGDPCSTGQILGIFGVIYSFYGDKFEITPDFENKVLKGSHYVKGRIRLWTILIIVIKLLLDKRFKELKMNYQLLKEAL